jgi:outer membrane protein assembly factor BamB
MITRIASPPLVWLLFFLGTPALGQTTSWPQWQGPERNSVSQDKGLLSQWPAGGPPQRWLFQNCGAGYGGPAIVDGRLYIMGTRDGQTTLIAVDAQKGDELWATPIDAAFENDWGDGPRSTPTVDGGRIYALTAGGTLVCVDARNGGEVWRITMESLGGKVPNWGYTESVLIDGNKVLCTPGGDNGAIVALDKHSGRVIWQAKQLDDGAQYSSIMPAEFYGQPQYVQLLEQRLVGLDRRNGALLWEVPFPGNVAVIPTPIIDGNRVFATSGYGAGCMLVDIGRNNQPKEVYANKLMKNHHGGVIQLGKYVYGYSDEVGWLCLDLETGQRKWREKEALGKGAIGYADGHFYCVEEKEGNVVLIDASPEGWTERGRFVLTPQSKNRKDRGGIWTHPVIVDGKLFLRDQEILYCFDVRE